MKKNISIIKTIAVCLFMVSCIFVNDCFISNASQVGGADAAVVEVEGYSVEGGMLASGKEITLKITLHNTSSTYNANNIVMTYSNESGMLYPGYGEDNQLFIGTLTPGDSETYSVPMIVASAFKGDSVDLTCQFAYETGGQVVANSSTIVIPKSGGSTIGVKSVNLSSHAIVNGKSLLSLSYVNQSGSNISDAYLIIDGNVSKTSKRINLDTIYSGKSYTQDFYVTFTKPGNQDVSITLVYSDLSGEEVKTDLGTFGVTVSKENAQSKDNSTVEKVLLWAGRGVALLAGVAVLIVIFNYIKKYR